MDWIEGLRRADKTVIRGIYNNNLRNFQTWILRNSGTAEDALDIFHDALEAIIYKVQTPDFQLPTSFEAYLFRICQHKWIDQIRRRKKENLVRISEMERYEEIQGMEQVAYDTVQSQKLSHILERSLQQLSTTCRHLLDLLKDGHTISEIAQELEMSSANTVYRRKFACMKRWKTVLELDPEFINYRSLS